jgi:integrase
MKTAKPKITVRKNPGGTRSYCVDAGIIDGKRFRRFFPSKKDARVFRRKMEGAKKKQGDLAFSLNPRQQIDAGQALELLSPYEVTLLQAVKYYVKHAQPRGGRKSLAEVVTEFLESKRKSGKKPRYLKELTCKLNRFKEDFGTKYVNEITRAQVEEWLDKQKSKNGSFFSPLTKTNYLRDLGIVFRFAMNARNYCAENPIQGIEKPQTVPEDPEIFTTEQALRLLYAAKVRPELEVLPYVAIGMFAGLRSSELEHLDWAQIDLRQRLIEVTAESAKTSQKRFVKISDNLLAWIEPYKKDEGAITPKNFYRRIDGLLEIAEIEKWPQNGLRHSFASYHYARHDNAHLTAAQLGHETTKMLFAHYRGLATPEQASDFWNIFPPEGWLILPPSEQRKRLAKQKPAQIEQAKAVLNNLLKQLPKLICNSQSTATV